GIVFKMVNDTVLWLVTQHSQHKGWSFPKGIVGDENKNESEQTAALREVQEEGGVTAKIVNDSPVETAYQYKFQDTLIDKTVRYFLMEYISGDPKDHDWEVQEAKFLSEDEVRNILTFKADHEAFEKILRLKLMV
ncbi:MAG: NUDIX domain-containing protein, partial [Patescibacteria group bacterium]